MTAPDHASVTAPLPIASSDASVSTVRRLCCRVRAWMVVLPIDAAMLASPAVWAPQQTRAYLVTALLGLVDFFLTGHAHYYLLLIVAAGGQLLHFPRREHIVNASFKSPIL